MSSGRPLRRNTLLLVRKRHFLEERVWVIQDIHEKRLQFFLEKGSKTMTNVLQENHGQRESENKRWYHYPQ